MDLIFCNSVEMLLRGPENSPQPAPKTPVLSASQSVFVSGGTAAFADLQVGSRIQVKSASELQAIFSSPSSQWSTGLGPRVQGNTGPRMNMAGQCGVVATVDASDSTVQIDCNGAKAWFTPGRPCAFFCCLFLCSPGFYHFAAQRCCFELRPRASL